MLLAAMAVSPDRCLAQTPPAKPTGFATEDGNSQVRLRWTGPNDPTITGWQYTYRLEPLFPQPPGVFGPWTGMPGSGAATRRFTVTGLRNNRTYTFKIRAVNGFGPGPESIAQTADPYPAAPEQPTGFRAIPGDREAVLRWNHADDASIQGWEYEQNGARIWNFIAGSDADTVSHSVSDLENGAEYSFRIRAYNDAGSGIPSVGRTVTPMLSSPGKPTGFAVGAGNRKVTLTWDDPGNDTITKWQFAYRTTGGYGDWTDIAGSGPRTVRHVHSPLQNDTVHTFKIRAVNRIGGGAESDEVSATPMASAPAKPTGLRALAGDGQVTLLWTDPSDVSIAKWQYAYKTSGDYSSWVDMPGSSAATTRHVVGELANGTLHTFKLRAVNDTGIGPESDEASATPLSVPAKPSGLTARAGDARVALGWDDPLNTTITGWQYSFRTSGGYGDWIDIAGSSAATTGHAVAGLSNGVEHTFRIRAINASGFGAESDAVAATPRPVPAKPAGLRAEAGNTQVRLVWTDPGDNSITSWQYSVRTTADYGGWADIPGSGAATVRHTVTGLANGTAHSFRIRAVNGSGAGPESDEASATPQLAPPDKPTGFRAEPGDGEVSLAWEDPDDASILAWQYKSRRSDGDYKMEWDRIPGSGAKTVEHTVTGLANGTLYVFKIRAVNGTNGAESDERSAAPRSLRPAAPTGLSAEPGDARVALAWNDPGDATITGWQYAVKTTGGFGEWIDIPGSDAATTAHTITGLDNGALHSFKLRAVNDRGDGAESGEVSATPIAVPAGPTGFGAAPGDGQVVLTWDEAGNPTVIEWQFAMRTTGAFGEWADVPDSDANTTSHTVADLDNGTAYTFRLRAVNRSGPGAASEEATATPVPVPARPTGFRAVQGDGQVSLSWDDPGNATVVKWQFGARRDGGAYEGWNDIPASSATTTGHTVSGLDNGVAYAFRIRAVNVSGPGAASDEATATPGPVPARPTGLTAMPGDGSVALEWDNPRDATITGWQYRIATTGDYGVWTDIGASGPETTGYIVAGLANGTVYRFRLRAVNDSGPGAESEEAAATPAPAPAKPTGLKATPGSGRVLLEWADPNDPSITGWEYKQRREGGEFEEYWTYILGSSADTTRYEAIGLEVGASYGFKVRAVAGEQVSVESDEVTVTLPRVPAAPSGLTATAGEEGALLEWLALGDPTVALWQYKYRTDSGYGAWMAVPGSDAATTSHSVAGLEPGVPHGFRIRAVNSSGFGLESDEVSAVPLAYLAKPAGFAAAPGDRSVLLEWDDPEEPSVAGWEYNLRRSGGAFEEYWTVIPRPSPTRYIVTGLENGVSYAFKLRAFSRMRVGRESDEATALPAAGLPAAPENLRARPGDRRAELLWDDPENPAITGWQYRYRTTGAFGVWIDIPGGDASLTGYTVRDLSNGTAHYFRLRAKTAAGYGPPSESARVSPVPAKPDRPSGLRALPGDGQVLLTWDAANDSRLRWEYALWIDSSGRCLEGTDAWRTIGAAANARYTVSGLANGETYCFQIRSCSAERGFEANCGPGSGPVPATLRPVAKPAERQAVKNIMAGVAGRVAAGAETVIGARFSADSVAPRVVLAGREVPLFAPARQTGTEPEAPGGREQKSVGMNGRDALRNSSFQVPFGPPRGTGLLQWSIWHRGDFRAFEDSAGPQARYGGRLLSTWIGIDFSWDEKWLAGAALARSKGEMDYAAGAEYGSLRAELDSVHPYVQRRFEEGGAVWMMFGGGRGTIEGRTAGRHPEIADTEMATVSAGLRSPLRTFWGLELSASGAAGLARLKADGDRRTALGSLSATADRQSLGVGVALREGQTSHYTTLSLRRQGGDGRGRRGPRIRNRLAGAAAGDAGPYRYPHGVAGPASGPRLPGIRPDGHGAPAGGRERPRTVLVPRRGARGAWPGEERWRAALVRRCAGPPTLESCAHIGGARTPRLRLRRRRLGAPWRARPRGQGLPAARGRNRIGAACGPHAQVRRRTPHPA